MEVREARVSVEPVLAVGISQAQAFLDGNKRTALFAMVTFLEAATDRFEAWLRDVAGRQD